MVFAIGYNTTDSYLYLLPALLLMCLWLAWGVYALLWPIPLSGPRNWLAGGLLAAPLIAMMFNFSTLSLRADWMALDFAEETLNQAAPHALLLVDDDRYTFALWYARYALGQRPDVAVVNINLLGYPWYQASLATAHPELILAPKTDDLLRLNAGRYPVYAVGETLTLWRSQE